MALGKKKNKKNGTGKFYFHFYVNQIYAITAHTVAPNSERTEKLR